MVNFSSQLKEIRKKKGLLQKELANKIGLSQSTIANYEKGDRFPSQNNLIKISQYLDVSLDYLMGVKEENTTNEANNNPQSQLGDTAKPLKEKAQKYQQHLLNGEEKKATRLIIDMLTEDHADKAQTIKNIYLNIFTPVLKKIGYLWETGEINVSQEHYCTAVTIKIMAKLHSFFPEITKQDKSLVAVTVSEEMHNIGLRIVKDFFELDGWKTYFLGSYTPNKSIIDAVKRYNAGLVLISVTMPLHINSLKNTIDTIKNSKDCRNVKVLAGGQAFKYNNDLQDKLNIDGYTVNAIEAVEIGNKLVADK